MYVAIVIIVLHKENRNSILTVKLVSSKLFDNRFIPILSDYILYLSVIYYILYLSVIDYILYLSVIAYILYLSVIDYILYLSVIDYILYLSVIDYNVDIDLSYHFSYNTLPL